MYLVRPSRFDRKNESLSTFQFRKILRVILIALTFTRESRFAKIEYIKRMCIFVLPYNTNHHL